jgi:hypothetical protein
MQEEKTNEIWATLIRIDGNSNEKIDLTKSKFLFGRAEGFFNF